MFVDDEVVIDGLFNENCIMQFETQEDRVLAFSVVDGNIKDALQLLNVWRTSITKYLNILVGLKFVFIWFRFTTDSALILLCSKLKIKSVTKSQEKINRQSCTPKVRRRLSNSQRRHIQIWNWRFRKYCNFIVKSFDAIIRYYFFVWFSYWIIGCWLPAWYRRQHPMWSSRWRCFVLLCDFYWCKDKKL